MATGVTLKDISPRGLEGIFTLRILDLQGNVLQTFTEHNMIVNGARRALAMLISEHLESKAITKFGVGVNNTAATPADTELTNAHINDIVSHSFPENGTVKFVWRLGYNEANGMNICEFGLYCSDGSLFSRKVREPIFKANDIAFEGEWSIIF